MNHEKVNSIFVLVLAVILLIPSSSFAQVAATNINIARNGLTKSNTAVELGGSLLRNTNITTGNYKLGINNATPVNTFDLIGTFRQQFQSGNSIIGINASNALNVMGPNQPVIPGVVISAIPVNPQNSRFAFSAVTPNATAFGFHAPQADVSSAVLHSTLKPNGPVAGIQASIPNHAEFVMMADTSQAWSNPLDMGIIEIQKNYNDGMGYGFTVHDRGADMFVYDFDLDMDRRLITTKDDYINMQFVLPNPVSNSDFDYHGLNFDNDGFSVYTNHQFSAPTPLANSVELSLKQGNLTVKNQTTNTFEILQTGDVTLPMYPSTRDDSPTKTPTNFLYTDVFGSVYSAPLTVLGVQAPIQNNNGTCDPLGITVCKNGNAPIDDLVIGTTNINPLRLIANNVLGLIVRDNGNVGIGTEIADRRLTVNDPTNDTVARFEGIPGHLCFLVAGTGLYCTSDVNQKQNIQSLDESALDTINDLRPVTFDWKQGGEAQVGFIAQELETVIPEAVRTLPNNAKVINQNTLIPYLVKSVQSLAARSGNTPTGPDASKVEELEKRIDILEARISTLEALIPAPVAAQ